MGKDNWNFNLPLFVSSIHAGLHFVITACLMHFWPDKFDARRSGKGGRLTIHSYVTQVVSAIFFCHCSLFMSYGQQRGYLQGSIQRSRVMDLGLDLDQGEGEGHGVAKTRAKTNMKQEHQKSNILIEHG